MYTAVVFDLFGTLVPYVGTTEFEASLAGTARALGCSARELVALWCTDQGFLRAVTGQVDCRTRIVAACDHLRISPTEKRIAAGVRSRLNVHREWLEPLPTTIETLSALRNGGARLGLMSVCSDEVPALWGETTLAPYFDVVLFSCDLGLLKSDPEFFSEACRRLCVAPRAAMYVGDSEEELQTAASVGMSPILMKTRKIIHWEGNAVAQPIEVAAMAIGELGVDAQQSAAGDADMPRA